MAKKRPMPGEAPNYQELRKSRFSWDTEGLMEGGTPHTSKAIRGAADLNRMAGGDDTPRGRAIQARARNAEGHDRMTRKAMQAIQENKRMADARAREAAAAKRRAARPKYAKGGKVTRGDGICKKGHTKGKMV